MSAANVLERPADEFRPPNFARSPRVSKSVRQTITLFVTNIALQCQGQQGLQDRRPKHNLRQSKKFWMFPTRVHIEFLYNCNSCRESYLSCLADKPLASELLHQYCPPPQRGIKLRIDLIDNDTFPNIRLHARGTDAYLSLK